MSYARETDDEPEGGLTIDCDHCALQATDACSDCVVSFLLDREPDDAVVIDADDARADPRCIGWREQEDSPWWRLEASTAS